MRNKEKPAVGAAGIGQRDFSGERFPRQVFSKNVLEGDGMQQRLHARDVDFIKEPHVVEHSAEPLAGKFELIF